MVDVPWDLLINFSSPFFISPRAPKTTGRTFVFVCHILSISRSLHFDSFSTILMNVFLSDGMATSIRVKVSSLLFLTIMSGLLADTVLYVWMDMFHRIFILVNDL